MTIYNQLIVGITEHTADKNMSLINERVDDRRNRFNFANLKLQMIASENLATAKRD